MLPIALSRTPAAASRRQRQPIRRNALRDRDACTSFVPIAVQFPLIAWETDVVPRATAAIASNPAPHARYHVASIICYHNVVVQVELVDSNNGSSRVRWSDVAGSQHTVLNRGTASSDFT